MTATLSTMELITYKIVEDLYLDERWNIFAKRTEKTEDKFKPKLIAAFDKQQATVLSRMANKPPPDLSKAVSDEAEAAAQLYLKGVFDPDTWQTTYEKLEIPYTAEALAEAGGEALREVGIGTGFDVNNPRVKKILDEKAFKFAKEVNETTEDRLRTALAQGFDKGEGIRELSLRVADVFDIAKGSRTEMIARTEVVGASNQGTYEGYIQSGVVETNVWVATRDNRTRDTHKGVDGQEVALDKMFSNGLRFPHDSRGSAAEVINCRCTHIAGKFKEVA